MCSHGLKLRPSPATFQPPQGRLTPALCPQLSLQRSFLAQVSLIPKGQRGKRVLDASCHGGRGPRNTGEHPGQQLSLAWTQGERGMELTALHICFSIRGGVLMACWDSSSQLFFCLCYPLPPSPSKADNTHHFVSLRYTISLWG